MARFRRMDKDMMRTADPVEGPPVTLQFPEQVSAFHGAIIHAIPAHPGASSTYRSQDVRHGRGGG